MYRLIEFDPFHSGLRHTDSGRHTTIQTLVQQHRHHRTYSIRVPQHHHHFKLDLSISSTYDMSVSQVVDLSVGW